jgi:hypothetical protein
MIKRLAVVLGAAAVVVGISVSPANAAQTGNTTVTFSISAGALNITVPATANIGSTAAGGVVSGQLGPVQVVDQRGNLLAVWTTTVTTTAFTTGGGSAAETIPASAVKYASGPATATTGAGVFTPGQATTGAAATVPSAAPGLTAFTLTLGVASNSATWNPTLSVTTPASAVAGTYTGTVTHSVA